MREVYDHEVQEPFLPPQPAQRHRRPVQPIMDSCFPMAVDRPFIVRIPSTDSYFPLILEEAEGIDIDIDHAYALSSWQPKSASEQVFSDFPANPKPEVRQLPSAAWRRHKP